MLGDSIMRGPGQPAGKAGRLVDAAGSNYQATFSAIFHLNGLTASSVPSAFCGV
jgi:hypothetical protein